MIEGIAQKIVSILISEDLIRQEVQEEYIYAGIVMLEQWITLITILAISCLRHNMIQMVLFLMFFFSLRKRTGGYHASSFSICYIATVMTCVIVPYFCEWLAGLRTIALMLTCIAAFSLFLIGTVNHPNINMEEEELYESKKAARCLILIQTGIIILCYLFSINMQYLSYIMTSMILCALLAFAAKCLRQEIKG